MKTCSKCGRTYPDHVDFCLRDGHPLVVESSTGSSPDPTPSTSEPDTDGAGVPIDLLATTDAFFPSLQPKSTEDVEEESPSESQSRATIDPNLDLVSTDIISVSRVREAIKQHKKQGPISLMGPPPKTSKATARTELIPRNWREKIDEYANAGDPVLGNTDPISTQPKPNEDKNAQQIPEGTPTDPAIQSQKTAPESSPDLEENTPNSETEATQKTKIDRPTMPFVFDGMEEDDIPSGFEDSTPLEDDGIENTGVLSRSFIQRTLQEAAKEKQPWEEESQSDEDFVPRGERTEGAAILEESSLQEGFAPPKGTFQRQAAYSHWSTPATEEDTEPAEQGLQELGPGAIEMDELEEAPPAPTPEVDPWFDPMAAATTQNENTEAAPPPSKGWMWAALAVMLIGVGGILGYSMQKKAETTPVTVFSQQSQGNAPLASSPEAVNVARSQPMPEASKAPETEKPAPTAEQTPTAPPTSSAPEIIAAVPTQGSLSLKGTPSTARVELDGKRLGSLPQSLKVDEGQHTLRISKSGYVSQKRSISVIAGEALTENFKLKRKASPAQKKPEAFTRLIISSSIQGAEVYINGRSVGKTPLTHQLGSGKHNVKVVASGNAPYTTQINIAKGGNPKGFQRVHAQF